MKRGFVLVLVMVLGVVGGISWSHAQQPGGSSVTALTGQDYAEIVHLFGRYNQGTDFKDAAMWLSIFTDDAVFQPGANAQEIVGQAALAPWRAQNFAARPADKPKSPLEQQLGRHPDRRRRDGAGLLPSGRCEQWAARGGGVWVLRGRLREDVGRVADQTAPRHLGRGEAVATDRP